MDLHIDTTEFGKATFCLLNKKKTFKKSYKIIPQESDKILEYLNKFLLANLKPFSNSSYDFGRVIKRIILYKKKIGSFTGLRIAAAIAEALSLVWQVPVKGKKI